jgi:hypothetical protein
MSRFIAIPAVMLVTTLVMVFSCRSVPYTDSPPAAPTTAPPAAGTASDSPSFFDYGPASSPPAGIRGWERPRPLTDEEGEQVAAVALNSPEASAWLRGRTDYRTFPVNWYAIVWKDEGAGTWWALEYEIVDEGIPAFVSPNVLWYPGVTIAVGEGTVMQVQVAVDLDSGKAAMVDGPYPSLSSPDRFRDLNP